ncbi:MAG: type I methionyl aminopeptidase [Deltaproteobacteria bacterium]|nr:type I methionyl aminopeptidase [Deltaproteobacteria bacterium]
MLSEEELPKMRAAGQLAASLLDMVEPRIEAGVTTDDIDNWVQEMTDDLGAISAPFGYHGFPAHCCTSINDVVCHGIPDPKRVLKDGDIINVDVTPILDGYYGDTSRTFFVGEPTELAKKLVETTYESLWRGIAAVKPGGGVGNIGHAIQHFVEGRGYSVVRQFTGHGIATHFHTEPQILHYGEPGKGDMLPVGTSFTIEPMINLGDWRCQILDDDWTAVTVDGKLSAQFEHTMVVTETGVEIFTLGAREENLLLKNV